MNPTPDYTDPAVLAQACRDMAAGMRQQAEASLLTSGLGGHPNPEYFFAQAADICEKAAEMISGLVPDTKPAPPPTVPPPTSSPSAHHEKREKK